MPKHPKFLSFLLLFLMSCGARDEKHSQVQLTAKDTVQVIPVTRQSSLPALKSHLRDTTYAEGSFILFLRPNNARYLELDSISEGLGDADSDFGVGVSKTLDSLKTNPEYKEIHGFISESRYIYIKDCLGGPLVIDRDSVNFGFIMSAPGLKIDKGYNDIRSADYTQEIEGYFFGRDS